MGISCRRSGRGLAEQCEQHRRPQSTPATRGSRTQVGSDWTALSFLPGYASSVMSCQAAIRPCGSAVVRLAGRERTTASTVGRAAGGLIRSPSSSRGLGKRRQDVLGREEASRREAEGLVSLTLGADDDDRVAPAVGEACVRQPGAARAQGWTTARKKRGHALVDDRRDDTRVACLVGPAGEEARDGSAGRAEGVSGLRARGEDAQEDQGLGLSPVLEQHRPHVDHNELVRKVAVRIACQGLQAQRRRGGQEAEQAGFRRTPCCAS